MANYISSNGGGIRLGKEWALNGEPLENFEWDAKGDDWEEYLKWEKENG